MSGTVQGVLAASVAATRVPQQQGVVDAGGEAGPILRSESVEANV